MESSPELTHQDTHSGGKMKFLFIPVSIVGGLIGGIIGRKLFDVSWGLISDEEAPEPEHRDVSWPKLLTALALQGALFRISRGIVERSSRIGFFRLTGSWPGEEEPEPT
jgi:hypothetical protein